MVKMFVLILAITLSVLTISVAVQVTTRTLPPLTPHVFPILACATGVLWVTRIALSCRDDILNSNESLERELQKSNEVLGQISAQLKFQSIVNQLEDRLEFKLSGDLPKNLIAFLQLAFQAFVAI